VGREAGDDAYSAQAGTRSPSRHHAHRAPYHDDHPVGRHHDAHWRLDLSPARLHVRLGQERGDGERAAQGVTYSASPSPATSTPFYLTGASPYVCDANDIVFYSAYNNPNAALQSGQYGRGQLRLTAIWLDTSGTKPQKTLWWQRDTNGSGSFDSGDRKVKLATNVVNTAPAVNKPIFTYIIRDSAGNYPTPAPTTLTSGNVATLVSVQVDIIVDANLSHTPTYVDLRTTVEPRNLGSL
jgi:hypothetical protein